MVKEPSTKRKPSRPKIYVKSRAEQRRSINRSYKGALSEVPKTQKHYSDKLPKVHGVAVKR